jgi:hypothetical protein
MRGAILPHLLYVFMAWCLVKHRDNFIFTLEGVWKMGRSGHPVMMIKTDENVQASKCSGGVEYGKVMARQILTTGLNMKKFVPKWSR